MNVGEVGDEAFSGASPQREGVLEGMCVVGEKQAVSNGSVYIGSRGVAKLSTSWSARWLYCLLGCQSLVMWS